MDSLNTTSLNDTRKGLKFFVLLILSILLVCFSLSIPSVVRSPAQKPISGHPLPFYIVGEFPGGGPKSINDYPYQVTTGNPWENSDTGFIATNFFIDIVIVFTVLFLIWIIKFKKYPKLFTYKRGAKTYTMLAKKFVLLFIISIGATLLTVFIPKFVFSNYDLRVNDLWLGFPDPFLLPKVPPSVLHHSYPYRLPYSCIFNGVKNFNTIYFRGDVVIMFIIILLFWYAYSKY